MKARLLADPKVRNEYEALTQARENFVELPLPKPCLTKELLEALTASGARS
jgi:hypothetical protein